ncbi:MAG TPA: acyloxyacyl hydrolase [Candidatus Sulfotelmatobacter sp.]|nr:acyloxyacyl hydrolase [Candidatus Sulfotelmatobacter sp.]
MRSISRLLLPVLALCLGLSNVISPAKAADDPAYLTIGAGGWEVLRDKFTKPEADISFRSDYRAWFLKPQAGLMFSNDGDHYLYGGFLSDIYFGQHVVLTPMLMAGYYGGAGFNLGSHFEFREGVEISYRFDNKYRLGAAFYHMSNAGITVRNPGSESALLNLSIPLGSIFSREELAKARAPKVAVTQFSKPGPVQPQPQSY